MTLQPTLLPKFYHPRAPVRLQRRPQILPQVPPLASLDARSTTAQSDVSWQQRSHLHTSMLPIKFCRCPPTSQPALSAGVDKTPGIRTDSQDLTTFESEAPRVTTW